AAGRMDEPFAGPRGPGLLPRSRELWRARAAARVVPARRHRDRRADARGDGSRAGVPAHHGRLRNDRRAAAHRRGARVVTRSALSPPAFRGTGWLTLLYKELLRFWKVSFQTIAAPVLTALLYLLIFSHVLESRVSVFGGQVRYTEFLVPGLVMMSVLQNAFANASSSLIQSKITGNLIFVLLPPLSPLDFYAAYVLGAMVRGVAVGAGVFAVTLAFEPAMAALAHPLWALAFALLGSGILATLGLIAGMQA